MVPPVWNREMHTCRSRKAAGTAVRKLKYGITGDSKFQPHGLKVILSELRKGSFCMI